MEQGDLDMIRRRGVGEKIIYFYVLDASASYMVFSRVGLMLPAQRGEQMRVGPISMVRLNKILNGREMDGKRYWNHQPIIIFQQER
jgi:hypothetical protein